MLSIIIPVLNEEKRLPVLLEHLGKASAGHISEIIIVDGGSSDETARIVKGFDNVVYLRAEKGRAIQMNAGADQAKSEILYFLHADSLPPANFDKLIIEEIKKGNKAGCFQMRFDKDHWWLRLMGWFTRLNHISCRGGDQSLFVERELFEKIGGFDESYRIYEDNEIVKRLYRQKQFVVIKHWLTTSARLYEKLGVWNTQRLFVEIYWKRRFGATADELHRHYDKRVGSY